MTTQINNQGDYLYTIYDDIIIPTELADVHYKAVITKRNRWIIQHSDIVIIYTKRNFGGAYNAKRYAERLGKRIIDI